MLAFFARKRTVVDRKLHRNRRRVDRNERQRLLFRSAGDGLADVDVFNASSDTDDAARAAAV
jgi:hypothetical protein